MHHKMLILISHECSLDAYSKVTEENLRVRVGASDDPDIEMVAWCLVCVVAGGYRMGKCGLV